jgi:hypothetical protein
MRRRLTTFTLRRMMAWVAFWAFLFAFALDIYPSVGRFLKQDSPTVLHKSNHAYTQPLLVVFLTAAIALPLLGAARLVSKPATNGRASRPHARRLIAVALVAVSAGIAALPVDGLRFAQRLRSGTQVSYLYQYSFRPGRHTEFCLEVIDSHGRHRHLIGRNDRYFAPRFFTNADQSVVWLVDESYPSHRGDGVLCSLNLVTGHFVGPSGPHPAVVTETGGFIIAPYVSATQRTPSPSGASSGQPTNRNAQAGRGGVNSG